jgi:hypothetical protein
VFSQELLQLRVFFPETTSLQVVNIGALHAQCCKKLPTGKESSPSWLTKWNAEISFHKFAS